MAHPRIVAWICFVCLMTLLLASCAAEPSDAQPAAAPSPVIETMLSKADSAKYLKPLENVL